MNRKSHWEQVYAARAPTEVSWYQARPTLSLELIERAGVAPGTGIIDVGGGTSTLVDALLDRGFDDLTVMDVASSAIRHARERLGERASLVQWLEADVTTFQPPRRWGLWHDRAVFHFLTEEDDREAYLRTLHAALAPEGHVIIATFDLTAPERCSGLHVVRYSPESLSEALRQGFERVETREEVHCTPAGKEQPFVYCLFQRTGG
jgi:trans-aconitate methyltransferase